MHIVCFDPRSLLRPGTIVDDERVPTYATREVGLLPIDTEQYYLGPCNGFSLRLLGQDGWQYKGNLPERGVSVPMFLRPGDHLLHFFARFEPIRPESAYSGRFKLLADGSLGTVTGALRPLDRIDSLPPKLDRTGGLNVIGKATLSTSIDSMIALMLHGVADNIKCVAFGVSALRAGGL